jgi:hypothetical protein
MAGLRNPRERRSQKKITDGRQKLTQQKKINKKNKNKIKIKKMRKMLQD